MSLHQINILTKIFSVLKAEGFCSRQSPSLSKRFVDAELIEITLKKKKGTGLERNSVYLKQDAEDDDYLSKLEPSSSGW